MTEEPRRRLSDLVTRFIRDVGFPVVVALGLGWIVFNDLRELRDLTRQSAETLVRIEEVINHHGSTGS